MRRQYSNGSVIYQAGQGADDAFIVESGHVQIAIRGQPTRMLPPGALFGEMSVLDGRDRSATATAIGDVVLVEISGNQLEQRVANASPIVRLLIRALLRNSRSVSGLDEAADLAAAARVSLESELTHAIDEDALQLHYQPIVDLQTRQIRGVEALLRWDHPVLGRVNPEELVLLAEETSLILALDRWGILRACQDLSAMPGMAERFVNINLSGHEVGRDDLVTFVADACDQNGLQRSRVKLEVTESALVQSPRAADWIATCGAHGFRTVIDDFGTGYSNLGYLLRLPVDTLKLDRTFIADVTTSPRALRVVEAIVAMAHALDMELVAEGIETDAHAHALASLGCQLGQGYLFAKPMSPTDLARALG